jgi:hypothetical protein
MLQIDVPGAYALLEKSLTLWRASGNAHGAADALAMMAHAVHLEGDIPGMVALGEESLALYRELDDRMGMAGELGQLGHAAWHRREYPTAWALLKDALALLRELKTSWSLWNPFMSITHVLWTLGNVARDQQDHPTARSLYAEGMVAAQEQGSAFHVAVLLDSFASLAATEGQAPRAARLLGGSRGGASRQRRGVGSCLPQGLLRRHQCERACHPGYGIADSRLGGWTRDVMGAGHGLHVGGYRRLASPLDAAEGLP